MFNTILTKRVKELERKLEYQKRFNDAVFEQNKTICKWLNKNHPNWDS